MFNLACRRQVKKIEIMNLENLNLVELNTQEVQEVDGGNIRIIVTAAEYILTAAGIYDAIGDFTDGWNAAGECSCGSW
jgi:hypothetical protein